MADRLSGAPSGSTVAPAAPSIQRVSGHTGERAAEPAPPSVERALTTPGSPLEPSLRQDMERRMGHDFGAVRIHRDGEADRSARDLYARAYTLGNDIAFGSGQYSPDTPRGQRLIAHELTHVVQQGHGAHRRVQRDLFYASGYASPYRGRQAVAQEIRDAQRGRWHVASIDMQRAAEGSGGGSGISTFAELLSRIEASAPGSINTLDLIAHSNSEHFAFAGRIDIPGNEIWFDRPDAIINASSLETHADRIAATRGRFAEDAKIVLYGCNAGADQALLEAISRAFGVCVEGFSEEIQYCISWNTRPQEITSRGRVWIADPSDPLPQERPDCAQFFTNVHSLRTDRKSCKGKAKEKELDFDRLIDQFDDATINKFWGTDEEAVYRVLQALGKDTNVIDEMRRRYRQKHKDDNLTLDAVIEDEFSGTELEFALQLINRGKPMARQAVGAVPESAGDFTSSAKRLHDAFFADWGTDEEAVYAVLLPLNNDPAKLQQLEEAYAKLDRDMKLRERIEDEMSASELAYALELLKRKGS